MTMTDQESQPTPESPNSLAQMVGEQTEQVTRLAGAAERIPESLGALEKSLNRYRRIYRVVAIVIVVFLVGISLMVLRLNTIANGNRHIQNQNQKVLDYIKDCTDPNGTCSKQSAARVEKAVQEIIDALNKPQSPTSTP